MARNYFLPCEIIPCEIVRDERGLALSSRNAYLTEEQKSRALFLSKSLKRATKKVMAGEVECDVIISEMRAVLEGGERVDYIAIVNRNFERLERVELGNTIILVAAWVGDTRLIDNLWI